MSTSQGKNGGKYEKTEDKEHDAVQQAGWDCGMVSTTRWMSTTPVAGVPKHLMRAAAKDIVKRGTVRKGRVMCLFADSIRPMKGGTLGIMKNLDTKCPCMDMEFPEGVLRFYGTLVFPKNKYLSLKIGANDVLCEDVFESAILFSKVEWIENNGSGAPVSSLPTSVIDRVVHKAVENVDQDIPTQTSTLETSSRRRSRGMSISKDEEKAEEGASQRRTSGRRNSGTKRSRCSEDIVDLCGSSPATSEE